MSARKRTQSDPTVTEIARLDEMERRKRKARKSLDDAIDQISSARSQLYSAAILLMSLKIPEKHFNRSAKLHGLLTTLENELQELKSPSLRQAAAGQKRRAQ